MSQRRRAHWQHPSVYLTEGVLCSPTASATACTEGSSPCTVSASCHELDTGNRTTSATTRIAARRRDRRASVSQITPASASAATRYSAHTARPTGASPYDAASRNATTPPATASRTPATRMDAAYADRVQIDAVHQERYWYPDEGGEVWVAGFQLVDVAGRYLGRDAPELVDAGLRVSRVAGARDHHAEALQSDAAAPGSTLRLRRDLDNEYDANAVSGETANGDVLGFVPRELAHEIAPRMDA